MKSSVDSPRPGLLARGFIFLVRCYQATLSPFVGMHCRFQPTCSHYSIDAFRIHGARRGLWLTVRRIGRCHPLGGYGYDPVPPRSRDVGPSREADHDENESPATPKELNE